MDVEDLELTGIIAFDGLTKNGLQLHPDQEHLVYPMGNKVTIKNIASGTQEFFTGHTNLISALCISRCGKFVGSGQINHLGFKAMVIVWDYEKRSIKGKHEIHKVRVEDVCFSCESNYLISLGGRDDGNIVIWDVHNNDAMCGSFASNEIAGNAFTICATNIRDQCFVTAGDRTLKVWRINKDTRKVYGVDVKVGKLRRSINCIAINERDEEAYCGTSSGDIIKARLNYYHNMEHMEPVQTPIMVGCYARIPNSLKKLKAGEGEPFRGGVRNLVLLNNDSLIVGAGDGSVELVEIMKVGNGANIWESKLKLPTTPQIKTLLSVNVHGAVTSMVMLRDEFVLVGTVLCEIYQLKLSNFDMRLLVTCHTNTIYDIAFPFNYSEVFATGSKNDIRVWRLETQKELLRITVPNFVCSSLCFSYDGKMIISAWNDGIIRAFTPQSGQLIFAIHNSHIKAVSAIGITMDGTKIISGGCDGQVRVWSIRPDVQRLACVLKEHRGPVTSLHISYNNEEVISSSTDGTCIIWDIVRFARKQVLMGNTMYMSARFSPNGVQVVTCGTDRKIAYWETLDGSLVREIEGSGSGALNCMDISPDGQHFVTGSNDCIVKLWGYHAADTSHIGTGHAAIVTACRFSPDSRYIVTVSSDGAIMIWRCPFEPDYQMTTVEKYLESARSRSTCSIREEEWRKLRLQGMHDDSENVADITARSEVAESVKAVHRGDLETKPCECDRTKPTQEVWRCRDGEEKAPISERGSVKSVKSGKTIKSISALLNKSNVTLKSEKSRLANTERARYQSCSPVLKSTRPLMMSDVTAGSSQTTKKIYRPGHCVPPSVKPVSCSKPQSSTVPHIKLDKIKPCQENIVLAVNAQSEK